MRRPVLMLVLAGLVGALVATPIAVYASHQFVDVPDDHTFHDAIAWLADTGITQGCNDDGDEFCPQDPVTRGQMAAFLRRFATSGVALDPDRIYANWTRYTWEESNVILARCDTGDIALTGAAVLEPNAPGTFTLNEGPFPAPPDMWTTPYPGANLPAGGRLEGMPTGWIGEPANDGEVVLGVDWAAYVYCFDVP